MESGSNVYITKLDDPLHLRASYALFFVSSTIKEDRATARAGFASKFSVISVEWADFDLFCFSLLLGLEEEEGFVCFNVLDM